MGAEAAYEIPSHQVGVAGPEASYWDCRAPVTSDTWCHGRYDQLQWLLVKNEQEVPSLEQTVVRLWPEEEDVVVLQRQLVQKSARGDIFPGIYISLYGNYVANQVTCYLIKYRTNIVNNKFLYHSPTLNCPRSKVLGQALYLFVKKIK